jgi:hypothetical protein
MDGSEISALEWGFGTLTTICLGVGAWLWARLVSAVVALKDDIQAIQKDQADYKLDAEKRFAKDMEVNGHFERLNDNMEAMRRDVGTINTSMAALAASVAAKFAKD